MRDVSINREEKYIEKKTEGKENTKINTRAFNVILRMVKKY